MNAKDYEMYPYSGIRTFLRADHVNIDDISDEKGKIGVMGVPFDEGCAYIAGQRFCASAIRDQSLRMSPLGIYDKDEDRCFLADSIQNGEIVDYGDVCIIPTDVEGSLNRTTEMAKKIIDKNKLLVVLGGDHTVSFPLVRAFSEKNIGVIYFDAHFDDLPIEENFKYTNGHPVSHILEMENVKQLVHIGGRTLRDMPYNTKLSDKCTLVSVEEYNDGGGELLDKLLDKDMEYYVSIDIDALDISLVPGCVSGEPGGLLFKDLQNALKHIGRNYKVVGFDMVEVAPTLDTGTQGTAYMAMLLVASFMGYIRDK